MSSSDSRIGLFGDLGPRGRGRKRRPKQALIETKKSQPLLPAAQTRTRTQINPEQMRELVAQLKEDHDYVIADCPAGIEQGFRNSIAGADRVRSLHNLLSG